MPKVSNKKVNLVDCTILISGPLISRVDERILIYYFNLLYQLKSQFGLTVLISTYSDELTPAIRKFDFQFIIVEDPGPDVFNIGFIKYFAKSNQLTRNTSRMLLSTTSGLSKVNTKFVIKTRIEILPSNIQFAQSVFSVINDFPETQFIVFIAEHFTGLMYTEKKPLLLWVPDTFQIMRTRDCLKLWLGALELWQKHKYDFMKKSIRIGLANEQILGVSLVNNFLAPLDTGKFKKLHRYSQSISLLNAQSQFEYFMFKSFYYDELFLQEGRFRWNKKPTPTIKLPLEQSGMKKNFTLLAFLTRRQIHQIFFYLRVFKRISNKFVLRAAK